MRNRLGPPQPVTVAADGGRRWMEVLGGCVACFMGGGVWVFVCVLMAGAAAVAAVQVGGVWGLASWVRVWVWVGLRCRAWPFVVFGLC